MEKLEKTPQNSVFCYYKVFTVQIASDLFIAINGHLNFRIPIRYDIRELW